MAVYYIVARDAVAGPGEINAGSPVTVAEGDIFYFRGTVADNVKFVSDGTPTNFEIRFEEDSLAGGYRVDVDKQLAPTTTVARGIDLNDVDIDAKYATSSVFNAGDGAIVGGYTGSGSGADVMNFGDFVTITDHVTTLGGDDQITMGSDLYFMGNLATGDGNDSITGGDNNIFDLHTTTGAGEDRITLGDFNRLDYLNTGAGADRVQLGLLDSRHPMVIDGESHDGADGDPTNDDVISIQVARAEQAAFRNALESHGYAANGPKTHQATSSTDYHVHYNRMEINDFETMRTVCFTRGTRILCAGGERPVEQLRAGDLVQTRDNGLQPIRWIGSTTVPALRHLAPVRIAAGTLGNRRTLMVSPQHRMLLSGLVPDLLFGESEVLAPAISLVNDGRIRQVAGGRVQYFHMLFDRHQVVYAEGAPSESFLPGAEGMAALAAPVQAEIHTLFPELHAKGDAGHLAARPMLKTFEGRLAGREMCSA
jgi:hypothetical protein